MESNRSSQTDLVVALIRARRNFGSLSPDGVNPHFRSKFLTLAKLLNAVTPALAAEGIVISCEWSGKTLRVFLRHEGGGALSSDMAAYELPNIGNLSKNAMQAAGQVTTYGFRIMLAGLLGIAADVDTDAECSENILGASGGSPQIAKELDSSQAFADALTRASALAGVTTEQGKLALNSAGMRTIAEVRAKVDWTNYRALSEVIAHLHSQVTDWRADDSAAQQGA